MTTNIVQHSVRVCQGAKSEWFEAVKTKWRAGYVASRRNTLMNVSATQLFLPRLRCGTPACMHKKPEEWHNAARARSESVLKLFESEYYIK